METTSLFAILSLVLYLIGFIPYIYHTFHGKVVPHPFSWTTWCIFGGINAYILLSTSGMSWAFVPMVVRTIALLTGAIFGWFLIKKIKISWFDYLFLFLSFVVIFFLYYYGKREAVFAMIIVDLLGLSPTLKKIYFDPESEDALAWFTTSLSLSCLIISLPILSLESSIFWFYGVCANLSVALYIRFWTKHRAQSWRGRTKNIILQVSKNFSKKQVVCMMRKIF